MPRDKTAAKVLKTVKKAARKGGILEQLTSKLSSKEKQQLRKAFKALDQEFIVEKANLLKDSDRECACTKKTSRRRTDARATFESLSKSSTSS